MVKNAQEGIEKVKNRKLQKYYIFYYVTFMRDVGLRFAKVKSTQIKENVNFAHDCL